MSWFEPIRVPEELRCHCGRLTIVNETLGYSRGLCEDCDAWRCDAYPAACRHLAPNELAAIERWRKRREQTMNED